MKKREEIDQLRKALVWEVSRTFARIHALEGRVAILERRLIDPLQAETGGRYPKAELEPWESKA